MASPSITAAAEPTPQQQTVFCPRRAKIVLMAIMGVTFWLLVAFLAWMPFGLAPQTPDWRMLLMTLALCTFIAVLGTWLLLLASRLRHAIMVADEQGLYLVTSGYEWWLWNPWKIRAVRIKWDEIQGVQYRVLPGVGEPLPQYVIHTSQGRLLLSSFLWPDIEAMAALICQRTGVALVTSTAEPAAEAQQTRPGRGEKLAAWAVRALGWCCLIFGCLMALGIALILATGQQFEGSLAGAVAAMLVLIALGNSLRQFRSE